MFAVAVSLALTVSPAAAVAAGPASPAPPLNNHISGDKGSGVVIAGRAAGPLNANLIGTTAHGDGRLGNSRSRALIGGRAWNNQVGKPGAA